MKKYFLESLIGLIIITVTLCFLVFARNKANIRTDIQNSYLLEAKFNNVDGINIGSDVRIAGVKIGTVTTQILDIHTYEAIINLSIRSDIKIPSDSIASVVSSGLLGKKYISIEPGAEDLYLKENQQILYTQSTVNIESLISKFMFKDSD